MGMEEGKEAEAEKGRGGDRRRFHASCGRLVLTVDNHCPYTYWHASTALHVTRYADGEIAGTVHSYCA